jgi:hypothetical protein
MSFPVDTKAVARKFHMSGGSVRLAIKNSLGAPEPNNQQLPRRDASNNQKAQSGKKSVMIKFTANPTIVDMWSDQSNRTPAIQFISRLPLEMLSNFVPSYLSVVELCALRSTCRSAWDCVSTHAFDNHIIPLCQGQYVAQCSPLGMMTGREYEKAGFILQQWPHPHNHACQVSKTLSGYTYLLIVALIGLITSILLTALWSCWSSSFHRFILHIVQCNLPSRMPRAGSFSSFRWARNWLGHVG